MKSNYEKLSEIIKEAEELLKKDITKSSTEFKAWKMKAERYLISCFGETSHEYSEFKKLDFTTIFWGQSIAQSEYVTSCHEDIKTAIAIFKVYLEEAKEESTNVIHNQPMNYSKVFIVHGHDGELKESVARVIEKQGIEAIILSEHSNQGRTVIEKFENYSDVGGTICLFTADDFGRAKDSENDSCRARQNVVFEAGYFMGKLGRDHVAILADKGVEIPSDLAGVVYTDTNNWQVAMLKELKAMGYNVDLNKLFD
jgi:predicted nucleotide-binding protein